MPRALTPLTHPTRRPITQPERINARESFLEIAEPPCWWGREIETECSSPFPQFSLVAYSFVDERTPLAELVLTKSGI